MKGSVVLAWKDSIQRAMSSANPSRKEALGKKLDQLTSSESGWET
ncbi:hypothetical protein ACFLZP_04240 [Patescibacteria group bacterium]